MTVIREPTARECRFGAVAHVGPAVLGSWIPLVGSFAVTLVVWWLCRESAFVARQARASINFQLSMTVYYCLALGYVLVFVPFGLALLASSAVFETVSMVQAARRAEAGGFYRYRMCLTFVRDRKETG